MTVHKIDNMPVVRGYREPAILGKTKLLLKDGNRAWINALCDKYRKNRTPFALCKTKGKEEYFIYLHEDLFGSSK